MLSKENALLLLSLMQGVRADWTTTITTVLTVSHGFAPFVDFTTTPPPSVSTPLLTPASSTPLSSFDSKHNYRERLTTVVTVNDGMIPVIQYSPIHSSQSSTPFFTKSSSLSKFSSASPSISATGISSLSTPAHSTHTSSTKASSTRLVPITSRSAVSSSSIPAPTNSNFDPSSSTVGPSSSRLPMLSTTPLVGSSSSVPSASSVSSATASSLLSSGKSKSASATTSVLSSSPARGTSSSQLPSYTYSSADLSNAPYLNSVTPSGSASATESAIIEFGATASPFSQPWGTLTVLPSGTVTGTAANSDATDIAFFLKGFYNNIGQLKTDPGTYKSNLEDVEKESEDYLSKVNYASSRSPCSGSLRKRSLFGAIGSLASSAANIAAGAVNEATSIVQDALSCIEPIADSMIKTIPDDVSDVTDDVEGTIKKGAEYLNEISDIVTDLENKIKDDNDENSSSESKSSTSSSTSSCTSSTTFSDCTTTTILVPTFSTGNDGSASPSTSTTTTVTCSTATACNASPTSMMTTTTEAGSCKVRRTTKLASTYSTFASSIPYIPETSSTGSGGSTTSTTPPTSPPSSSGISTIRSMTSSSGPGTGSSSSVSSSSGASSSLAVTSSGAVSFSGAFTSPGTSSSSKVLSSLATTSSPKPSTTSATPIISPTASSYICYNQGGPSVSTPYCECSTITESQTYWATASLISGQCWQYTSFPSTITLTPSFTPTTPTATPVPYITTETDGEILSYPSQIITDSATEGVGTPVTLQTPSPTQTSGNDKGSGECHSIDDACTRAYEQYVDDTIYSAYTSYTANIESGIIVDATFGKAGCAAMFTCDNDDYGFGMTGRQIKAAVEYMFENDSAEKCGSTYLSNSCHITLNYCTSCKATQ